MLRDPSAKYDTNIMDTLQNHLFEFTDSLGNIRAFDLLALNINRGRDHGIPTYNTIRQLCGYSSANKFSDLTNLMSLNNANLLSSIYRYRIKFPMNYLNNENNYVVYTNK
jgi:peroxidase